MRKKTTARDRGAEHPPGDGSRPVEQRTIEWSPTEWRAVLACMDEAYAQCERRLVDLRHETVDRFAKLLAQRGLSTRRSRVTERRRVR